LRRQDIPARATLGVPGEVSTYPQAFATAFTRPPAELLARHREMAA
jgi:hypothetical protein